MFTEFRSLPELMIAFQEPQTAIDYFTAIRWRNGRFCPYCGVDKVYDLPSEKNRYLCAEMTCHRKFSAMVGTIFENTKLPLRIWFGAMWLITNHKKGIASTTLARDLRISQKAAWFMLHRLRHAAALKSFNKPLVGTVEVDETFVGGKAANRHKNKRDGGAGGIGSGKSAVIGAASRKGGVVARVIETTDTKTMDGFVHDVVSPQADMVATDEHSGYRHLGRTYPHEVIRKSTGAYGDGDVHTNTIEGVWSMLKRQIVGIHHHVSPKHLDKYVGEMTWRINRREMTPAERVRDLMSGLEGRLTYKALIQ